jgi:two-component system response regulator
MKAMNDKYILLVEDNDDDLDLTLRAFKKANIANRVEVARDGVDALDFLFGIGEHIGRDVRHQPQVVLLDLNLPRLSGLDVLSRMRKDPRTRLTPVVILTSSKEEQDRLRGYALGANSYICKPVDSDQFAEAAKELGLYWLVLNEVSPVSAD